MRLRTGSILGLALSDRGVSCAQVRAGGDARRVERLGHFEFPAGSSLDKPEDLGPLLAVFLRSHRFTSRRAVVGLPAKWLFAEEREIPPAGRTQSLAMLRL